MTLEEGSRRTVLGHKKRRSFPVLIVSSDVQAQDSYVDWLRLERVPAYGVETWQDAARLMTQIQVSVVIVDVDRPQDWGALREIRQHLPPTTALIVLSGWVRRDCAHRTFARQMGCAGFLAKPCSASAMLDAVRRTADGCRWVEHVEPVEHDS